MAFFVEVGCTSAVKIRRDGTGRTLHERPPPTVDIRHLVETEIVVCMAGPAAEARIAKRCFAFVWDGDGAYSDRVRVDELLALGVNGIDGADRYERETRDLLRAHWPAITRVAEALLEHKNLTGDQVRALIGGAR